MSETPKKQSFLHGTMLLVLSTAIAGAVILAHACVTEKEWE